ncbi:hypothetical protein J1N35_003164 [Gossypium stocksii]|uniref:Uncharacterized protein n=1 Tax=Gossypium stocksii TaxID=47602 RepID=A0A9D3WN99_9ROSI|nr:hypothetical protein J1N35_003164 [Gossypium stocksii]
MGAASKRDKKNSSTSTSPCAHLRSAYNNCFNQWYSEKFVKGQWDKEECVSEWQKYRDCLSVTSHLNLIPFLIFPMELLCFLIDWVFFVWKRNIWTTSILVGSWKLKLLVVPFFKRGRKTQLRILLNSVKKGN